MEEEIKDFIEAVPTDGFDANGNIQDTNYNVVCDEYSIGYTNTESHVVRATFRRVYEP